MSVSVDSDGWVVLRPFPIPLEPGDYSEDGIVMPRHVTLFTPAQAITLAGRTHDEEAG